MHHVLRQFPRHFLPSTRGRCQTQRLAFGTGSVVAGAGGSELAITHQVEITQRVQIGFGPHLAPCCTSPSGCTFVGICAHARSSVLGVPVCTLRPTLVGCAFLSGRQHKWRLEDARMPTHPSQRLRKYLSNNQCRSAFPRNRNNNAPASMRCSRPS